MLIRRLLILKINSEHRLTLDDREALNEAIAETDEELMEKYFGGEEFTDEEFSKGLLNGIAEGLIVPILTCCSVKNEGITEVLDAAVKYLPKAGDHAAYKPVTIMKSLAIRAASLSDLYSRR